MLRRRFGEVLADLVEDCAALAGGPEALTDVLDIVVGALDAVAATVHGPDGVMMATSTVDDPVAASVAVEAKTPDGGTLVIDFAGPPTVTDPQLVVIAMLVGLVANVADARRVSDARFDDLRQGWGQEIHDAVTSKVLVAITALERVRAKLDGPVAELLETTGEHVRQSLVDLREALACVVDDDGRLVRTASGETLRAVVADVRTRWRLQARVTVRGNLDGLDPDVSGAARAVVREALINIAKHADARRVSVSVSPDPSQVRVSVIDDGVGLAPSDGEGEPGFQLGLRLLEQRVELAGGTIAVDTTTSGGTEVIAILPRTRG